ncbi:hypothetical protein [Sphingomonas sp. RB1R13]|uniref:hypothetical protein n=1 Tax=Sphingomonas sp. RB1R13 TaxID=3096159 RepID=UPI002FCA2907
MDAFEQLAADIFWNEGYWVRTSVKVDLTREDKERIGKLSSPRWEIDLLAYQPVKNELLALECKSYLDSGGVIAAHFTAGHKLAGRYKLFHDEQLRTTVLRRLLAQSSARGLCPADAQVRLGLVHGHVTSHNERLLQAIFTRAEGLRFPPAWMRERVVRLAEGGYENSTAAVVAKMLLKGAVISQPANA